MVSICPNSSLFLITPLVWLKQLTGSTHCVRAGEQWLTTPSTSALLPWSPAGMRRRCAAGSSAAFSEHLRNELVYRDEPDSLEQLIRLCIRLDNRLRERRAGRHSISQHATLQSVPHSFTPLLPPRSEARWEEPMQLGRAELTPTERSRRIREGEGLYCGLLGHFRSECPVRPKGNAHQ